MKSTPKGTGTSPKRKAPAGRKPSSTKDPAEEAGPPPSDNFTVVGVGASAGGLEAFTELLKYLPAQTGMAFVLVQHLDPHHESALAGLLSVKTAMPVLQVQGDTPVEPDRVYVIPPNSLMVIADRVLSLNPRDGRADHHLPIDTFFVSLAEDRGASAIGVVLSGTASDGTLGLKAIKNEGGITFAQDHSAKFDSMPRNAIAAGAVDFVLPPRSIAKELAAIARHPYRRRPLSEPIGNAAVIHKMMVLLRHNTGVDFTQYKEPTIRRRLMRRMVLRKIEGLEEYLALLARDSAEIQSLFNDLLINVTEFFRDAGVFEALKTAALPLILRDRGKDAPIRVWVPACSSGEEVYSIAIAIIEHLEDADLDYPMQMFGTDVSEAAIARARAGVYPESALSSMAPERIRRFFVRTETGYQISRAIRETCVFSLHNIAKDPPLSHMDLISCRNLLIYFTMPLQRRVIATLGYALKRSGCLMLGTSEGLGGLSDYFDTLDAAHRIYRRKPNMEPAGFEITERLSGYSPLPRLPLAAPPEEKADPAALLAAPPGTEAPAPETPATDPARRIRQLEQELVASRQYLQTIIEELRSTNEEAQSANEELQSTNEELQTAKEELQSTNEELNTINAEMGSRNAELDQLNDDLNNLLSSMNMPIVMLDNELRIRRFTPTAAKVLHVIPSDVGRPIGDLKPRINVASLEAALKGVLETLTPYEQEVQDQEARWYLMRVRPYRTKDNRIEGAVLQLLDVNDLRRSTDEVRQARDFAQAIVDTVREPLVVLDQDLSIRNANRSFYEWFDVSPSAAAGRTIFHMGRGELDVPRVHELLDRLRRDVELHDVELEHNAPGGEKKFMLLNARRLKTLDRDLILLAFEDVTVQKRAAEARYRRLFESARDGIVIVDAGSGNISDINPSVEQMFGFTRDRIVGQKLWEIGPLRDLPQVRPALERIRDHGVLHFPELTLRTRDGRDVLAEVVANVYSDSDRSAIQFNIRDLTERKKFERELQHTQKLESLGLLAGGIAHDFNNLLTGIMGNASLAYADTPPDQRTRTQLREIVNAAERAAHLTRQMLAYAGKGQFVVQRIDVGDMIREISTLIKTSIPKTVELSFDIASDLPAIEADPGQIQQLIMNLVINGAEAIGEDHPGKVEIQAGVRQLSEMEARESYAADQLAPGAYVRMEVKDSGCGMDDATRARIFDPFYTTKFTGRGLGLAAVLGIVKGHRGAIRVYSAPGDGSSFQVLIPASAHPAAAANSRKSRRVDGAGATVLVIDDEEVVRNVAKGVLERAGFNVLTAHNGQAGVELFRQHSGVVALIVLDLLMPVMGGEETLEQLQAINPAVPVLLSSGLDQLEASRRFGGKRAAGFIQKPYDVSRLLEAIAAALSHGQ